MTSSSTPVFRAEVMVLGVEDPWPRREDQVFLARVEDHEDRVVRIPLADFRLSGLAKGIRFTVFYSGERTHLAVCARQDVSGGDLPGGPRAVLREGDRVVSLDTLREILTERKVG